MTEGLWRVGALAVVVLASGCDGSLPAPEDEDEVEAGCPPPPSGVFLGGFFPDRDSRATSVRRIVLMGGGAEDDRGAALFVEAAGGGDIVVMRTSGSLISYPHYFTELAADPAPASVVTVLTSVPEAADHPSVLCRLARAEAIWLAGGDQWDYLGRWPDEVRAELTATAERSAALGGTSAGAMSLGEAAFDARHGGVTSADALANPLHPDVSLSYPGLARDELGAVLADSHFSDRGREGRLLAFLARFLADRGAGPVVGIGLDEGAALVLQDSTYTVSARADGALWFRRPITAEWRPLYEVAGPAMLASGEPLSLNGIRRVVLGDGSQGGWPFDFEAAGAARLVVEEGLVRVRPDDRQQCSDGWSGVSSPGPR